MDDGMSGWIIGLVKLAGDDTNTVAPELQVQLRFQMDMEAFH